jgi:dTDP-4-amino-4,6-dideoxygalactose transaminase
VQPVNFVDLKRQYATIKDEVDAAVLDAIASTQYILGEEVTRFESEWAEACGVEHCVGVSSGTAGLALAYEAVGIGAGDEVIAPANTFIATILPLVRLGARVVLVDCDEYGQLDVEQARAAVTAKTKAVAGVDLFGHPCDADAIRALCDEDGLVFVEDAAQAHGAGYRDRTCGSLGRIAAFSFYPGKNLGAYGDAGAVLTDDPERAQLVRALANHGGTAKYRHDVAGFNSRLDGLQAVVLRAKLARLADGNRARRAAAARYDALLADLAAAGRVVPPVTVPGNAHVWHLYVVKVVGADRDAVVGKLNADGIGAGVHYPAPVHLTPAFAHLGHRRGDFRHAEEAADRILSLPLYPQITADQQQRVVQTLADALR